MHKCEFCPTEFTPRPQVKRPRACPGCQGKRQRSNESDWRKRNPKYSYATYHELMRGKRKARLEEAAAALFKCIEVGRDFLGMKLKLEGLSTVLGRFLQDLGIRRVNKFWDLGLAI